MISRIRIADGNAEKSSVRKCQNLAVLDRTFDSIYQGPVLSSQYRHFRGGPIDQNYMKQNGQVGRTMRSYENLPCSRVMLVI